MTTHAEHPAGFRDWQGWGCSQGPLSLRGGPGGQAARPYSLCVSPRTGAHLSSVAPGSGEAQASAFCSEASGVAAFWPKDVVPTGVLQAGSLLSSEGAAGPPTPP